MKILLSSTEIEKEIITAIGRYSKFYWTVAWARVGSKAFEELKKHRTKINTLVVGTHFFQTHPKFIEEFMRYVRCPTFPPCKRDLSQRRIGTPQYKTSTALKTDVFKAVVYL